MSLNKHEHAFGHGHFVGDISRDMEEYQLMDDRDQARLLGWIAGCPVVEELTDPNNSSDGRGAEAMVERYAEVNVWFTLITEMVWEHNRELADAFYSSVDRHDDDVVGKYEDSSIPADHFEKMAPIGTLAGYAMPRIFIEQLNGTHPEDDPKDTQDRVVAGLDAVERVSDSKTPLEFTARLAEELYHLQSNPYRLLKHLLPTGWLDEHGAEWMIKDMKQAIADYAPEMWKVYTGTTHSHKQWHVA
ncbi:MAG TPA: hypothetical protein PK096_03215 [Candidatus Saccharibacteria bacterium]|nr:hypothetical protein [Candidatus Saccharibacteria bacterium]HRK94352.1 hypothetical protein [Candidatus Saccharibacteria bacterium]